MESCGQTLASTNASGDLYLPANSTTCADCSHRSAGATRSGARGYSRAAASADVGCTESKSASASVRRLNLPHNPVFACQENQPVVARRTIQKVDLVGEQIVADFVQQVDTSGAGAGTKTIHTRREARAGAVPFGQDMAPKLFMPSARPQVFQRESGDQDVVVGVADEPVGSFAADHHVATASAKQL